MKTVISLFLLVSSATGQTKEPVNPEPPVITVCEALQNLTRYKDKLVVIVGRYVSTEEGSWLSEDCERRFVTEGYAWRNIISTFFFASDVVRPAMPTGFAWHEKAIAAKLKEVQSTTKLWVSKRSNYRDKWVAMVGRLESRLPQEPVGGNGAVLTYGLGHLNLAPAQLIWPEGGFKDLKDK